MNKLSCFKAYDVRGKVPGELNEELAYQIALAYIAIIKPKKIVIGYDARLESINLTNAIIQGFHDCDVAVINIGLCGTEEVYYQCFTDKNIDGGIMVTASHNPKGYNGMKLVEKNAAPMSLSGKLGLLRDYILNKQFPKLNNSIFLKANSDKSGYINHLLSTINCKILKPYKIVANFGNGPASIIIKLLAEYLPFKFIYINDIVDGNFPNGVPNPMLQEQQEITAKYVVEHNADMGIAWDGDFDRCFFFDENGAYVENYYIIGLLAKLALNNKKGATIIHDPRLIWNIINIVLKNSGKPVQSPSGHSIMKQAMYENEASYGGEMSGHHYFKEFGYCDSGMIPWLKIIQLMSKTNLPLSHHVKEAMTLYPCSGERNYQVYDFNDLSKHILNYYIKDNPIIDKMDGLSLEFPTWRFNIRASNTENLVRLNIEVKNKIELIAIYLDEIEVLITASNNKFK